MHFPLPEGPGRQIHATRSVKLRTRVHRHARHHPAAPRSRRRRRQARARKSPQPFLDVERFTALEGRAQAAAGADRGAAGAAQCAVASRSASPRRKGEDAAALMAEVSGIGDEMKAGAQTLDAIQRELSQMLMGVPNLPHDSVPVGADEKRQCRGAPAWGEPRTFDFAVKDHVDLGAPLGHRFRNRREAVGLALHVPARPGGAAASGAWRSSCSMCRPASTATPSATRRTSSIARSSKAPGSCRSSTARHVLGAAGGGRRGMQARAVPDLHVGDLADQQRARADPEAGAAAAEAHRAQPVLPQRGRQSPGATRAA